MPIPIQSPSYDLLQLLKRYLHDEEIQGYICPKCSSFATRDALTNEFDILLITHSQEIQDKKAALQKVNDLISMEKFDALSEVIPERVKVETDTIKETLLSNVPQSLCLHLQRSVYLPNGRLVKNSAAVTFPDLLDLKEIIETNAFIDETFTPNFGFLNAVTNLGKQSVANNDLIANANGNSMYYFPKVSKYRKASHMYKLKSIILHYGHHEAGHFIAIRRVKYKTPDGMRESWFRISDSTVDKITDVDTEVFARGSNNVYMLFYEAI